MRQWSKVLLLSMIGHIPMPSQSNISQSPYQLDFSKLQFDKQAFDVTVPGFAYLKKHGIETLNIPNGIPLDIGGFNRITDLFGPRYHPVHKKWLNHNGIDISGNIGTDIYTTGSGTISYVGIKRGYGKCIIINHGKGIESLYAHLNSYSVKKGDKILKGDIIGQLGNSGVSTGAHLHYEVRLNNLAINPVGLMIGEDVSITKCELAHIFKTQYNEKLAEPSSNYYIASTDNFIRSYSEKS